MRHPAVAASLCGTWAIPAHAVVNIAIWSFSDQMQDCVEERILQLAARCVWAWSHAALLTDGAEAQGIGLAALLAARDGA